MESVLRGIWHDFACVFPELAGEEQKALQDDIRVHGVRVPIVVFEGKVLDGRNRYMAARDLRIEFPVVDFLGTPEEALGYVISTNLHRRHLKESQRASVAAQVATLRVGRPPSGNSANLQNFEEPENPASDSFETEMGCDREQPHLGQRSPLSQQRAAEVLNVSTRTVAKAHKVQANGIPELVAAVHLGQISLNAAEKIAVLPEAEQKAAAKSGVEGFKARAKSASGKKPVKAKPADSGASAPSRKALEDELTCLCDENLELLVLHERQQHEITRLKDRIEELTAADPGAVIGSLQAQLASAKAARDRAMKDAKAMEWRLKNALRERDAAIEARDTALNALASPEGDP